jgi:hyperosmotically inducible periplasmic protein
MALLLHRSTSTFRTEVSTTNGIVIINGSVENSAEKELITKLVEDIQGVKSVENKMTILKEKTSTVGEKLDDSVITAKVKMALVIHRSTGVLRTSVTTNDAVVTVSGKALNIAEKELVSKVIEDVDGVKSVVNEMNIE